MTPRILEHWNGLSSWERAGWVLIASLIALAVLVKPVVRWANPELAGFAESLAAGNSPASSVSWRLLAELVAWSRLVFGAAALLMVWSLLAPWARSPRSPALLPELLKAALLASVPILIALGFSLYVSLGVFSPFGEAVEDHGSLLLLPGPVALAGSLTILCYLLALAWRLSRPPNLAESMP